MLPKVFLGTPHLCGAPGRAEIQSEGPLLMDLSSPALGDDEITTDLEHLSDVSRNFARIGWLYVSVNFCQSPCSGVRVGLLSSLVR